jgi:hypothetical protein
MKETTYLFVNHLHSGIYKPIDNSDNIPIFLCNIYHESFEFCSNNSILEHEPIEFSSQDTLGFYSF